MLTKDERAAFDRFTKKWATTSNYVNTQQAAEILDMSRQMVNRVCREHGIGWKAVRVRRLTAADLVAIKAKRRAVGNPNFLASG